MLAVIDLETWIKAPIERCFDLSRDIDLHMQSTAHTREVAVAGVTKGLIGLDEEVTWEATHFGIRLRLTSRITAYRRPFHFRDSRVRGAFRRFDHDLFSEVDGGTLMRDVFDFESPLGILGDLANWAYLRRYMTALLERRNRLIKEVAEQESTHKQTEPRRSGNVRAAEALGIARCDRNVSSSEHGTNRGRPTHTESGDEGQCAFHTVKRLM